MNEETKQVWDNLFQKLNEKEKTFLTVVNNEKNKEIARLYSIIQEAREEIIKDREKNYSDLEKKAFYCNKTDKLLEILDKGE